MSVHQNTILAFEGRKHDLAHSLSQGKLMARAPQGITCRSQLGRVSSIGPLIGVCPQQNVLWPEITAEEHLRMFAAVKGIHGSEAAVTREIEAKLGLVGLLESRSVRVGRMSGGMQRRLSLAIAVLGDPPVIVLDEPTTGVDPYHRSIIWGVVAKLKQKSTFLLTTHDMNECEILSDQVAVMAGGKVQCEGTTVALKQQHGSGYYLRVLLNSVISGDDLVKNDRAKQWILNSLKPLKGVVLVRVVADCATLHVPSAQAKQLPPLLRVLENAQENGHVMAWDVSLTSLEEVLLAVSKDTEANGQSDVIAESASSEHSQVVELGDPEDRHARTAQSNDSELISTRMKLVSTVSSTCNILRALLIKNAQLQRRQWCQNLCLILAPLTALIMVLALNSVVQDALRAGIASGHDGAVNHENAGSVLLPSVALPLSDIALFDPELSKSKRATYLPIESDDPHHRLRDPATMARWPEIWFGNKVFGREFGNDCFVYFQILDKRGDSAAKKEMEKLLASMPSRTCQFFNVSKNLLQQEKTTRSDIKCQPWNENSPHANAFISLGEDTDKCRDPAGVGMPWCYTMNPDQEFQFCHANSTMRRLSFNSTPGFVVESTHAFDPARAAQNTFFHLENQLRSLPANRHAKHKYPKLGPAELNALPDGLVVLNAFGMNNHTAQINYTFSINDISESQYHRANDFGVERRKTYNSATDYASSVFAGDTVRETVARGTLMQVMSDAMSHMLVPYPPRNQVKALMKMALQSLPRRRMAAEGFGDRYDARTHKVISHNKVGCYLFSDLHLDDIHAAKKVIAVRTTLWPAYCEKQCGDYPFFLLWLETFCICLSSPPSRGAVNANWCRHKCRGTRRLPWFLSECGSDAAGQLFKRNNVSCKNVSAPSATSSAPSGISVLDLLETGQASGVLKPVSTKYAKSQCAEECGHVAAGSIHKKYSHHGLEAQVGRYHIYRGMACYWNDFGESTYKLFNGRKYASHLECSKICDSMPNCTGFELSRNLRKSDQVYCAPWFGACTNVGEMHDNGGAETFLSTAIKILSPDVEFTNASRSAPTACTDSVFDWHSSLGSLTCEDFRTYHWCTRERSRGNIGRAWDQKKFGNLHAYDDSSGISITKACCVCGGGVYHPLQVAVPKTRPPTARELLAVMLDIGVDIPFEGINNKSWSISFATHAPAVTKSSINAPMMEVPMETFIARTGEECMDRCITKPRHVCIAFRFVANLSPMSEQPEGPHHEIDTQDAVSALLKTSHTYGRCTLFSLISQSFKAGRKSNLTAARDFMTMKQLVLTGRLKSRHKSCSAFALSDAGRPLAPDTGYNQSFCLLLDLPAESVPSWPPPELSFAGLMPEPSNRSHSTVCINDKPTFKPTGKTAEQKNENMVLQFLHILDLMRMNFISTYPRQSPNVLLSALELLDVLLLPIILTLQLPMLSYNLVWERQEGLRSLQRSMGVMPIPYYLAHYLTAICLYVASMLPYVVVSYAAGLRLFSQTNYSLMLWFLVGCCNATVGMSWLVAAVLPDRRQALVVGLLCVFVGNALGMLLSVGFYGRPLTVLPSLSTGEKMPLLLNICPIFAVCRVVYLMAVRCAALFCYDYWPSVSEDELGSSLCLLHLVGIALIFLAAVYDWTQPLSSLGRLRSKWKHKQSLTRKHCCCSPARLYKVRNYRSSQVDANVELRQISETEESGENALLRSDRTSAPDTLRQRVLQVTNMTKIYPNGKRAVCNVTLGVEQGEVLGLLGVNGAGKSTLLGLITGRLKPSDGWWIVISGCWGGWAHAFTMYIFQCSYSCDHC